MPKYRIPQFEGVPAGEYQVEVVDARIKISSSRNEMIVLTLSADEGATKFRDHLVFAKSSAWKIAAFLTAMGEELVDGMDVKPHRYIGRKARALIAVEEYKGGLQNKVATWLPPAVPTAIAIPTSGKVQPNGGATPTEEHDDAI